VTKPAHIHDGDEQADRMIPFARFDSGELPALGAAALQWAGAPEAALDAARLALAFNPAHGNAANVAATALSHLGRQDEAIRLWSRIAVFHWRYRYNLAMAQLTAGDFAGGWENFEARHAPESLAATSPVWRGEAIAGRTILLYAEQGLGDTIQFVRYAPAVARRGARVILQVPPRLKPLMGGLVDGNDIMVVGQNEPRPGFDAHCPLLSLPRAFATRLDTIPAAAPYLAAGPGMVAAWARRLPPAPYRVGIAWQGNPDSVIDRGRSVPLACFAPLARVPGVQLVSLQRGVGAGQLDRLPAGMTVIDPGAGFDQGSGAFMDTAAVMMNLDLVVTSDTSIAHLAGALGRPVWVALQASPDWRWLRDRDDSPWYPAMRLFRQKRRGEWDEVFARIAGHLVSKPGSARSLSADPLPDGGVW
jgi:hypothetical protein